jgi:arabinose-5-phosphate isomerase
VARKLAATFSSTGTPSYFLHPSEALHGDLGMIREDDLLLAVAYGGETFEVLEVARFASRLKIPVIALTGNPASTLAKIANLLVDGSVPKEACPLELAPTSSSTLALALGDALAMSVMKCKGFSVRDFANIHPGGSLGRKLQRVGEKMQTFSRLPVVDENVSFAQLVETLNQGGIGHVAVVKPHSRTLVGCFTDGDLRRQIIAKSGHFDQLSLAIAKDVMSARPSTLNSSDVIAHALNLMELKRISGLFVLEDQTGQLCGFLHLQDLVAQKML